MAQIIFISGGCRSGKSDFAQNYAEQKSGTKIYIANAPLIDDEMKARALQHQKLRKGKNWITIEEQVHLKKTFENNSADIWLIDCITMWINNLQYHASLNQQDINEMVIADKCNDLIKTWEKIDATIILVSDEIGMGLIPENQVNRQYRDFLGRANRIFAEVADKAYFVVSGIALPLKG